MVVNYASSSVIYDRSYVSSTGHWLKVTKYKNFITLLAGGGHLHREADPLSGRISDPDVKVGLPQGQDRPVHPQLGGVPLQRRRGFHP